MKINGLLAINIVKFICCKGGIMHPRAFCYTTSILFAYVSPVWFSDGNEWNINQNLLSELTDLKQVTQTRANEADTAVFTEKEEFESSRMIITGHLT